MTIDIDDKRIRRVKRVDRLARLGITLGGLAIIVSVIGILLLIVQVAVPMFQPARSSVAAELALPEGLQADAILAAGMDEYRETGYVLDASGTMHLLDLVEGRVLERRSVPHPDGLEGARIVAAENRASGPLSLLWEDGAVSDVRLRYRTEFDDALNRTIAHNLSVRQQWPATPDAEPPQAVQVRHGEDDKVVRVDLMAGNRFRVFQSVQEQSLFGAGETKTHQSLLHENVPGEITDFIVSSSGNRLFAATSNGALLEWDLSEAGAPEFLGALPGFQDERRVTELDFLIGDLTLLVGDEHGTLSNWFKVRPEPGATQRKLRRIRSFGPQGQALLDTLPSVRSKMAYALYADGSIRIYHTTSERRLLHVRPQAPVRLLAIAPRDNGMLAVCGDNRIRVWHIDCPHPDISWKTLFGKVWYEGFDAPDYVWQSSSGDDDFEPKLSLVPLIFGSFKGTLYAMIFALPLALGGALYTSQFTTPEVRGTIKPTVEIMAAIPSVVVGFLIALWLAPIIEEGLLALFLSLVILPLVFLVFMLVWQFLSTSGFGRVVSRGYEFLLLVPLLLLGVALCFWLATPLEDSLFSGNFRQWLYDHFEMRYDQRNAIIISFGLGFAVIPIIFTIAEDSLSNVPSGLRAASLALGASRWQTAWRVVLPSASPGIFAGAMIGFGRAIGETMIVLMATGNTPVMDWSLFNGMRTLSANIAVEIPEAPVNGTLYRVLFLSAVLLFMLTFLLNTVAELVRHHLRKKYGRFE